MDKRELKSTLVQYGSGKRISELEEYTKSDPWFIKGYHIYLADSCNAEDNYDSSEYWAVLCVRQGFDEIFVKVPGYYSSDDGAELEFYNLHEVSRTEKTITVWE